MLMSESDEHKFDGQMDVKDKKCLKNDSYWIEISDYEKKQRCHKISVTSKRENLGVKIWRPKSICHVEKNHKLPFEKDQSAQKR